MWHDSETAQKFRNLCICKNFFEASIFIFNILVCLQGYFLNSTNNECSPCPIATYSETKDADSCTPCPEGLTTSLEGSNNISLCRMGMQLISLFLQSLIYLIEPFKHELSDLVNVLSFLWELVYPKEDFFCFTYK